MKNVYSFLIAVSLVSSLGATPAVMGGITYNFGGDGDSMAGAGATVKVLSNGADKKPMVAAGFSYFPWAKDSKKFGLDLSAGYNIKNTAVMGGWDFIQHQPTVSLGYNKEIKQSNKYVQL